MVRIELFRPKPVKGIWEIEKDKLYFIPNVGEPSGPHDQDLNQITKYFNGMYNLGEAFLGLAKKGNHFSFIHMFKFINTLSKEGVFKNGKDFCKMYDEMEDGYAHIDLHHVHQDFSEASFTSDRIKAYITKTCLVASGESEILTKLVKNARVVNSKPGDVLIAQGSEGKEFCLLMSGKLGVYREEYGVRRFVTDLRPICIFGESPAISGKKRNAEVSALKDSWILAFRIHELMDTSRPEEFTEFQSLRTRLLVNQILSCSPLFQHVPSEVMSLFINKSGVTQYEANELVVKEGEFGDLFYVILDGQIDIEFKGGVVANLKKGDYFGEVGALLGEKRTASARTTSKTYVICIRSSDLYEILCDNFYMAKSLETEGIQRIKSNYERMESGEFDSKTNTASYEVTDHSFSEYDFEDLDFSSISISEITGVATELGNDEE